MTNGRISFLRRYFEDDVLAVLKPGFDWLLSERSPGDQAAPHVARISGIGRRLRPGPYVIRASVPGGPVETVRFRLRV